MTFTSLHSSKSKQTAACLTLALVVALAPATSDAVEDLCVPSGYWTIPKIDGDLTDPGWIQATRYVHANGTGNPHGALQAAWVGAYLYVSLEAHNDDGIDKNDIAVLAFGAPPNARMLEVRMTTDTAALDCESVPSTGAVPAQTLWRTSGAWANNAWSWSAAGAPPAGYAAAYQCDNGTAGSNTNKSWTIELKLPAAELPAGTSFPFYAAIVRSGTIGPGLVTELTWPPPDGTNFNRIVGPISNLPPPSPTPGFVGWGTMKRGAADCAGMTVATWEGKIRVNGDNKNVIKGGATNTFDVWVRNTSPKTFDKIRASFYFQRFGISGKLTPIPPPDGGMGLERPETTVMPGSPGSPVETNVTGLSWTIPAGSQNAGHACVGVMLDQGAAATEPAVFQIRGGVENMEFDGMSKFTGNPVVKAAGLRPSRGDTKIRLGLQISPDFRITWADGRTPAAKGTPVVRLNVPVHGYQFTREYLKIDGKDVEIAEPVSSFAYVLDHALALNTAVPPMDPRLERMRMGPPHAAVDPFRTSPQPSEAVTGSPAAAGDRTVAAPKIALPDFGIQLTGTTGRSGSMFLLDLDPETERVLEFAAEYPKDSGPCTGCCCRRTSAGSGPSAALVVLGLAALSPLRRRRR